MKLHRIRTLNLNSLYDEQEVDFDRDLEGAGLFLIQGPTGSGKSTLMDAISLALFATTPRLEKLNSAKHVAEQVMSRGMGKARAEVEFSKPSLASDDTAGVGRVRYRAVWTARRARDRADGKMQDVQRSMEELKAQGWVTLVSDHRRANVQPVFKTVLEGFSAHDFQRSMLLAQGHFDAMLHADPAERAAILERLTDTKIYQQIGERAARMRGGWQKRLAALRARVEAISPLDTTQLDDVRQREATSAVAFAKLEAGVKRLIGQRGWLQTEREQQVKLTEATTEGDKAEVAFKAAAPDLAALAQHERCGDALALLDADDRAATDVARNQTEQQKLTVELPALRQRRTLAEAALGMAKRAETGATQTLTRLRPPAQLLSEAERTVAERRMQLARRRAESDAASAAVNGNAVDGDAGAASVLRDAEAARLRAQSDAQEATAAMAQRQADTALVEALPALETTAAGLHEAADILRREQQVTRKKAVELDKERTEVDDLQQRLTLATTTLLTPLEQAVTEAAATRANLAGDQEPAQKLSALEARRDALRSRAELLQTAQRAVVAREVAGTTVTDRMTEAAAAATTVEKAVAAVALSQEALTLAETGVQQTEAALVPVERMAALSAQRAALEEGDACPLCGSADHPLLQTEVLQTEVPQTGAGRAPMADLEAEMLRNRDALRDALREAEKRCKAASHSLNVAQQGHAGAVANHTATATELSRAQAILTTTSATAMEALAGTSLDAAASVAQLQKAYAEVVTQGKDARRLRDELQEAITSENAAKSRFEQATKQLRVDEQALADRRAGLKQAQQEQREREQNRDDGDKALRRREAQLVVKLEALGVEQDETGLTDQTDQADQTDQPGSAADAAMIVARRRVATWQLTKQTVQTTQTALDLATGAMSAAQEALEVARAAAAKAATATVAAQGDLAASDTRASEASDALVQLWRESLLELTRLHTTADDGSMTPEAATAARVLTDGAQPGSTYWPNTTATATTLVAALERYCSEMKTAVQVATNRYNAENTAFERKNSRAEVLTQQGLELTEKRRLSATTLTEAVLLVALADVDALRAIRLSTTQLMEVRRRRDRLIQAQTAARTRLQILQQQISTHRADRATDMADNATPESLQPELEALQGEVNELTVVLEEARTTLAMAQRNLAQRASADAALKSAEGEAAVWLKLHELIGKGDGKRFKLFAQALNLDQLLTRANTHLEQLDDRYRLRTIREPDTGMPTLEFRIEDRWQGGSERSLKTLSGGESFLVSLALALGLSDLRTSSMPVETLLLDEGFGTLDPKTLDTALAALQRLQASGRQVGIISHVVGLQESIEARIDVEPIGEGRSRVRARRGQI